MNNRQVKLLAEYCRIAINQKNKEYIIEENFLRNSMMFLSLAGGFLGQMSGVSVADAMPPTEIAYQLDDAFQDQHPGTFDIHTDSSGNVVGTHIESGKNQLILTSSQCDNISQDELDRALRKLDNEGYRSYKKELSRGAESPERILNTTKSVDSKVKRSLAERIKSISPQDKKELLDDFMGDNSDGNFNLSGMHFKIAAQRAWEEDHEKYKKFGSEDNVLIYLIMLKNKSYRVYLPKR